MSKVILYSLEENLPLYNFSSHIIKPGNESILSTIEPNTKTSLNEAIMNYLYEEESEEDEVVTLNWIGNSIKIGNLGEEIAERYLLDNWVGNVRRVSLIDSSLGYDLEVTYKDQIDFIEVKTTLRDNNKFQITSNELQKAHKLQDNYYIFYIKIDQKEDNICGYLIKNPLKSIGIDLKEVVNLIKLPNITILPNKFLFQLNSTFIGSLKMITLNKYKRFLANTNANAKPTS